MCVCVSLCTVFCNESNNRLCSECTLALCGVLYIALAYFHIQHFSDIYPVHTLFLCTAVNCMCMHEYVCLFACVCVYLRVFSWIHVLLKGVVQTLAQCLKNCVFFGPSPKITKSQVEYAVVTIIPPRVRQTYVYSVCIIMRNNILKLIRTLGFCLLQRIILCNYNFI